LNAIFSRVSAFSKTQRIERSSSIIQTGLMIDCNTRFQSLCGSSIGSNNVKQV
jgi:hypothetical protein